MFEDDLLCACGCGLRVSNKKRKNRTKCVLLTRNRLILKTSTMVAFWH